MNRVEPPVPLSTAVPVDEPNNPPVSAIQEATEMIRLDGEAASRQELRLVAVQPAEMQGAQRDLVGWAQRRLSDETQRAHELQENYDLAVKNKWRSVPLKRFLDTALRRIVAFQKIKTAIEDGYVIIPDFPVTIIAIRTGKEVPLRNWRSNDSAWPSVQPDQKAELLPIGTGEYVSPKPEVQSHTDRGTLASGVNYVHSQSWATAFQDVEFPFILAKPAVLDATSRAMANKIFDEIGVAPDQALYQKATHSSAGSYKQDPMIIGRIHVPIRPGKTKWLSFMIAWFLDESMLP